MNKNDNKLLNVGCGAEFVQKEKKFATGTKEALVKYYNQGINTRVGSFDGDADRLVYL